MFGTGEVLRELSPLIVIHRHVNFCYDDEPSLPSDVVEEFGVMLISTSLIHNKLPDAISIISETLVAPCGKPGKIPSWMSASVRFNDHAALIWGNKSDK